MPRYDYDCAACGTRFEVVHGLHAEPPSTCPTCGGGPIRKAFAPPAIHFKGSGWAKKERRATTSPARTPATTTDGSGGDGTTTATGDGPAAVPGGDPPAPTAPAATASPD